ncbi:transcriptional repressor [bacterium]|nr:transcriptional repressor [bacterium]
MATPTRRSTRQRAEILAELRAAHDHPAAAEIHERLRARLPRLSLGTVYRNLDVLVADGLITKLAGFGGEVRFDGRLTPHDHAWCRRCGAVTDIPAVPLAGRPHLPDGFALEGRRLEYTGTCAACGAAGRP